MNGDGHFDWNHSHGKINKPRGTYNPRGIFMYFDNYNVEVSNIMVTNLPFLPL